MTVPPCIPDAEPTAGPLLDHLTLDVTSLAQRVTLAASVPRSADVEVEAMRVTTLSIWEELTGLERQLAVEVARAITTRPGTTTAAVVPF